MRHTFFLHTDGIWTDKDMPAEYPDELASIMATELEAMFPGVEFDWIISDNDTSDTRNGNPATVRDNAEALEANPEIEDTINRAYTLALENMEENRRIWEEEAQP